MSYTYSIGADVLTDAANGRIFRLTSDRLNKVFEVKGGEGNTNDGVLYYNDVEDLVDDQVATLSTDDKGRFVIMFLKGTEKNIAKFVSTDCIGGTVCSKDNAGYWVDR
ncbi:hypothetical protein FA15DRAFT_757173 [Coprinopsis marcescibilis]|uniref:Uncharacterized protein n=1 Tax=Coprinopsis marcescibilis TaxID=230819 RepID=A0A5C3KSR6_COPMA|nr:hypothetical protein FA15DRAFT_757173 [Coprinopsis marcescibilis]